MIDGGMSSGWATARLGEFCVERVQQHEPTDDAVPYIDIGSINRDTKAIGELQYVTRADAPTRARQWVCAGDVLVSMTRPNLNAVAIVPPALDGAVASTGFDVLRAIEVLPEWVFNRVRSHDFVVDVCEGLQGVVYPAIRPYDVRQHEIPVPPLPEQHRIVEAIESYFTRLDDAVATLEDVRRNLKRYRASVLKAAVEGRLVPTEAELARAEGRDYEPALVLLERILVERRRRWETSGRRGKYQEPVPPDTTDLTELPEGWCWVSLGLLKEFSMYGPRFSSDDYADEGRLVLRTSDISESGKVNLATAPRLRLDDEEFRKYRAEVGDLLVTRTGSLGTLAVFNDTVDAIPGAYLIQFRLAAPIVTSRFCFYVLKSPIGQAKLKGGGAGVGRPNLNAPTIEAITFGLPPHAEQSRTVAEVERLLSVADALDHGVATNLSRCARLRQSILKWAFEGRLADQDPNDEPASALLERIKAERPATTPTKKSRLSNGRARATA